ncbi:MAG: hypothetical protein PWQ52_1378 [Methanolobus sp.]|nr:hypothetical protein [Methanolobus sp.]
MKTTGKLFSNESAIELPINIVVMLVVGMVALAALIAIIPPPTKNMSVNVDQAGLASGTLSPGNTILVDSTLVSAGSFPVTVQVSAKDPDGYPVRGANVVLRGLGGAATGVTDDSGMCTLQADTAAGGAPISLGANQNEGAMDLKITASGFYDYEKTNAVMIVRTS